MKRHRTVAILAALGATLATSAVAQAKNATTLAVFGDLPYTPAQIANFDMLPTAVNADPDISRAIHLGDIKSGSTRCDDATYLSVRATFDKFHDPLVFVPGDNEWTDCHRVNNGGYLPTERLAFERSVFFPTPGRTLGINSRRVSVQKTGDVVSFPEHVRWQQGDVTFVTLNVPGSNNDLVPWLGAWSTPFYKAVQADEVATRTDAVLRWIDRAFAEARDEDSAGVAIAIQADLWDPLNPPSAYTGYTKIVQSIATHSRAFKKPVLLMNGDSHIFGVDHPLADPTTALNVQYGITSPVPNLTRMTVQGSTTLPSSWVKVTIDEDSPALFSFEEVPILF